MRSIVSYRLGAALALALTLDQAGMIASGQEAAEEERKAAWTKIAEMEQKVTGMRQAARFLEARTVAEEMLALAENAMGPEAPETANSLSWLASVLYDMGDLPAARPLFERALAIREKVLGREHPDTAASASWLAGVLQSMGDLKGARPLFERALATREKALGPEHPDTAASLDFLASLLLDMGDLEAARSRYERSLAIREKALGPNHLDTATSLDNLGLLLQDMGEHKAARPLHESALAIYEKALGPEHPDTATCLNNLARVLQAMGDLSGALPLQERASGIFEKALGPDHPTTATGLNRLASLLKAMGDLEGARPLCERELAIRERVLGPDHPHTATSLNNLALLLQDMGDLAGARPLCERALATSEKALGPEHPDSATSLNNLASLLDAMGDLAGARKLYERALAIREKSLGPDHPVTATSLNNLALLLYAMGDLEGARPLYHRALAIYEESLGPDHPDTARALNNLALLLQGMDDLAGARELHERALAVRRKALGPDHPDTAQSFNNLACLLQAMRDFAGARPHFERALAIWEKALGPDHPDTAMSLNNLARLLLAMGDLPAAQRFCERAWQTNRRSMHTLLLVQSSRERCAMLQDRAGQLGLYLTAFSAESARTYAAVLAWKGAALRVTAVGQRLPADAPPAARALADHLAKARSALAQLILSPPEIKPGEPTIADHYATLAPEIEKMERDLAALQPDFAARAFLDPTPEDVLAALPAGTALVDVLENEGKLRCWVLLRGKEIRSFDLGKAADVAPLADAFRQVLERRSGDSAAIHAAWRSAGEKLRAVLAAPLVAAMDGTQEICFCLDGTLATVPLGLLPWGEGEPGLLIESVRVRHQTSGAGVALAAATKRQPGPPALLVLGGVDYGTPGAARPGGRTRAWSSLSATEKEANAIAARFRRRFAAAAVTAVAGKQATEAAVKAHAPAARYIHAATHGFFELEALSKTLAGTRGASAEMDIVPMSTTAPVAIGESHPRSGGGQNPLLLSGLILAGANAEPRPGEDDGWLTAEELQGLDLTATELVVLSACSTGRGELAAGEGVLGLQRALTVAGARGFLLSLWAVPDADTQELMERFYDTLWAKDEGDPADALRAAQLALLAEDRKAGKFRPHRWGAWVLVR